MKYAVLEEEYPNRMLPFTLTRPSFELVYRYRKIIEWYSEKLGNPAGYILPERFKFKYLTDQKVTDFDLIINSTVKPEVLDKIMELKDGESVYEGDHLVARKGSGDRPKKTYVKGYLLSGPWDLVKSVNNPPFVTSKIEGEIENYVILDDRKGPIIIEKNSRVEAFSKIIGPAYISSGSTISPARISTSYVGVGCRIGGELERSIMDGFSNKAHYGFIGDSYIGMHVNIGAGSTSSNLKNTYGTVKVKIGSSKFDTKEVKLGAFIGDFSRISINTSIMAGKLIGAGAHVQGNVNKNVKPFTFFNKKGDLKLIIIQIERYLKRRNIELDESLKFIIKNAYNLVWNTKNSF
ncbi:MAG: putative sugar nucleotidyl transferase [Nitrososphaeria archaeon]